MFSPQTITDMATEAAKSAAAVGTEPRVSPPDAPGTLEAFVDWARAIPFLGDPDVYMPDGWELTGGQWLVDNSGMGSEHEPALTIGQFRDVVAHGDSEGTVGYGIVEAGLFQVVIAEYVRTP